MTREQLERMREEERFYGDVEYEVWRSGGNPDMVDHNRIDDWRPDVDGAARSELRRQRRLREEERSPEEDQEVLS